MTVVHYARSEGLSTNDTTEWMDKLSLSGFVPEGEYKVVVCAEYGGTATNRKVAVRLLIDDVEVNNDRHTPEEANTPGS